MATQVYWHRLGKGTTLLLRVPPDHRGRGNSVVEVTDELSGSLRGGARSLLS